MSAYRLPEQAVQIINCLNRSASSANCVGFKVDLAMAESNLSFPTISAFSWCSFCPCPVYLACGREKLQ